MLFGLIHALIQFICVVLLVRLALPSRYLLLNPYAAALDRLLARSLQTIHTAFPFPSKVLCFLLFVLLLCTDAVMLSRLGANVLAPTVCLQVLLPTDTFVQWLLIAFFSFFNHYLMVLAAYLALCAWNRSRQLPGYSGDLLRLAGHPFTRFPIVVQVIAVLLGAAALVTALLLSAKVVEMPFEKLLVAVNSPQQMKALFSFTALALPVQIILFASLTVLHVVAELHHLTSTLIFFAILSFFVRSSSLSFFITDVFRLLKGPLPDIRIGFLNLTPILILIVLAVLSGFLPILFIALFKLPLMIGG